MNEQVLQQLLEVNVHLRNLEADIHKLVSALARAEDAKTSAASAISFQKRS